MAAEAGNFSINVFARGVSMLEFLERVDERCFLMNRQAMAMAVERYGAWQRKRFNLWRKNDGEHDGQLPAPFDVCFVWHAHMIRTPIYRADLSLLLAECAPSESELEQFCSQDCWAPAIDDSPGEGVAKRAAKLWSTAEPVAPLSDELCSAWALPKSLFDATARGRVEKLGTGMIPIWNERFLLVRKVDTAQGTGIAEIWRDSSMNDLRASFLYRFDGVSARDNMADPGIFSVRAIEHGAGAEKQHDSYSLKAPSAAAQRHWAAAMCGGGGGGAVADELRPHFDANVDAKLALKIDFLVEDFEWLVDLRKHYEQYSSDRDAFLKTSYDQYVEWLGKAHRNEIPGSQGPELSIDLFWHAHLAAPAAYKADTQSLYGATIWHQPAADQPGDDDDDDESTGTEFTDTDDDSLEDLPSPVPVPPSVAKPPLRCARVCEPVPVPPSRKLTPSPDLIPTLSLLDEPVRCSRLYVPDFPIPAPQEQVRCARVYEPGPEIAAPVTLSPSPDVIPQMLAPEKQVRCTRAYVPDSPPLVDPFAIPDASPSPREEIQVELPELQELEMLEPEIDTRTRCRTIERKPLKLAPKRCKRSKPTSKVKPEPKREVPISSPVILCRRQAPTKAPAQPPIRCGRKPTPKPKMRKPVRRCSRRMPTRSPKDPDDE